MIDDVRPGTIAMLTTPYGDATLIAVYTMELRSLLEIVEGEKIEHWTRVLAGSLTCGLTIEAWIESM